MTSKAHIMKFVTMKIHTMKIYINKLNTMFENHEIMLVQIVLWVALVGCKFCGIMSPWKRTPLTKKNGICNHWKLNSSTYDLKITYHENYYHENLKIYINEFYIMKWTPWDYTCANGVIPSFDLCSTHFVITCHH